MKKILSVLLIPVMLFGCQTYSAFRSNATPKEKALAAIADAETGLKFAIPPAITTWLIIQKDDQQRQQDAAFVYSAGVALNALSTGAIVTPDQIKTTIESYTKSNARYEELASLLVASYSSVFRSFQLANTSPAKFISEIAILAEDAAKPYLAPAK